jgi:WD40 repeat protein
MVLHAREIATGVDRWVVQLPNDASDRHLRSIASLATSGDGNTLVVVVHTRFVGATNDLPAGQIAEIRRRVAARIVRVETDTGRIGWIRPVPFRGRLTGNRSIHPTSDGLRTALNHTGSRLALCDARGNLRVWDKAGQPLHRFPQRLYTDPGPLELEMSPDGRFLLGYPRTGESINRLFLFDLDEQKSWTFDPLEQISDATFTRDGTRLIWAAWDGDVRAWDLAQRRPLWQTRVGSGARLLSLANGQTVAATYFGDVIRLGSDGTAQSSRNLSPLCYPQQAYEPIFRPDR